MTPPLDEAQKLDWLHLIRCDNVGPRTFHTLLRKFGGARAALEALPKLAAQNRGERAIRIVPREAVEREWIESGRRGIRFVALGEAAYPEALGAIDAAPPLLAVRGRVEALSRPAVAIVGSRNASASGLVFAERIARGLSDRNIMTVSGLARGIDAVAHRASLSRGTVAVLAGGHAKLYPPEHAALAEAICETGAVVSEMPLAWEPRGRDFPRRNRIVSGLSLGTVVVEAARRSGSLITARFAAEQGREIFAVPGSPLDPRAEGTNDLIRAGATLCARIEDVTAVIEPLLAGSRRAGLFAERDRPDISPPLWDEADPEDLGQGVDQGDNQDAENQDIQGAAADPPGEAATEEAIRQRVVGLLGPAPVALDDLVRLSDLRIGDVQSVLLDLELAGRLERHGGNLVSMRY